MRGLVIATAGLAWCGSGCISGQSLPSKASLYPIYRIPAAKEPDTARSAPATPVKNGARFANAALYPRGRRISSRWTHIVIHHSATSSGGARRFDKHHRQSNGWDELGYHFVIGNGTDTPDGFVEVGPRWYKQKHGAHCKTPDNYFNEHGIGICLVGDFTQSRPTPRQLAALARLVRFLGDRCGVPPERVTTHHAIKKSTRCPGEHFRLASLRRALARPMAVASLP